MSLCIRIHFQWRDGQEHLLLLFHCIHKYAYIHQPWKAGNTRCWFSEGKSWFHFKFRLILQITWMSAFELEALLSSSLQQIHCSLFFHPAKQKWNGSAKISIHYSHIYYKVRCIAILSNMTYMVCVNFGNDIIYHCQIPHVMLFKSLF